MLQPTSSSISSNSQCSSYKCRSDRTSSSTFLVFFRPSEWRSEWPESLSAKIFNNFYFRVVLNLDRPPGLKKNLLLVNHTNVCRIIFYKKVTDRGNLHCHHFPDRHPVHTFRDILTDLCGKSQDHCTGSVVYQAAVEKIAELLCGWLVQMHWS
jgi:hypothetical protein